LYRKKALSQITALKDSSTDHPAVIECTDAEVLTEFLKCLVTLTGVFLADILHDRDNTMVDCWVLDKEAIQLSCIACQTSLEWRIFVSQFRAKIPKSSALSVWKTHCQSTPQSLSPLCWEYISDTVVDCFPLLRRTRLYNSLEELLRSRGAGAELWNGPYEHLTSVLHWETTTVSMMVELLFHAKHKTQTGLTAHPILVCYSDYETVSMLDTDEQLQRYPQPFPPETHTILCLVYKERHHAVFEIRRKAKLVIVYDGQDATANPESTHKDEEYADTYWSEYATQLLKRFRLLAANNAICIGMYSDLRNVDHVAGEDDEWQIQSVVSTYPLDWQQRLIRQFDFYSCGRIAVLHMKKLLGFELDIHYDVKNEDACRPKLDALELASYLPNADDDMHSTIQNWIAETILEEKAIDCNLTSHIKRSDVVREFAHVAVMDPNVEHEHAQQQQRNEELVDLDHSHDITRTIPTTLANSNDWSTAQQPHSQSNSVPQELPNEEIKQSTAPLSGSLLVQQQHEQSKRSANTDDDANETKKLKVALSVQEVSPESLVVPTTTVPNVSNHDEGAGAGIEFGRWLQVDRFEILRSKAFQ